MSDGSYQAFTDNGREATGKEVLSWAQEAVELGAGEVLLTSIDQEGTGSGMDLDLTRMVSRGVSVPVIASGGAGRLEDVSQAMTTGEADAVALAAMLHYGALSEHSGRFQVIQEGNVHFLQSRGQVSHISATSLPELKAFLIKSGISCRPFRGEIL
jgi:cyclase